MAAVNVTQVTVLNNPAMFTDPLAFEIQYEALYALDQEQDLEWKLTYVGSAENDQHDQVLETIYVGPVVAGAFKFVLEANAPDPNKVPQDDLLGVTAILLTCSYRAQEFIRIGYYVNNEYTSEELKENPPDVPVIQEIQRTIIADHPRVTRFPIDFDAVGTEAAPEAGAEATIVPHQDYKGMELQQEAYNHDSMDIDMAVPTQ